MEYTKRYKIVFEVTSSTDGARGMTSYHVLEKTNKNITNKDIEHITLIVERSYNTAVDSIEPIQTIDQLTGERVLFSGSGGEAYF